MSPRQRAPKGQPQPSWNETRKEWEVRIEVPVPPGQPRARKWVRAKTRAGCLEKMTKTQTELTSFGVVTDNSVTVAGVAALYLEAQRKRVVAGTLAAYEVRINHHVVPLLGQRRLGSLTTKDVDQWQETLEAQGLSVAYRKEIRSSLVKMINWAIGQDYVMRNVASRSAGPRGSGKKVVSLTKTEAREVLAAVSGWRLEAAVVLMMMAGLRIGEALGLHWLDLSLEEPTPSVTISGQLVTKPSLHYQWSPKTQESARTVDLPLRAVTALMEHRSRQAREREALGLEPAGPADFVFLTGSQTLLDPSTLSFQLKALTEPLGIKVHPHKLRHTAASLMIDQGVPIEIVSKVLGHKSIRTTLDIYGHLLDRGRGTAASALEEALG